MSVVFDGKLFADYHQIMVEDSANADGPPEDFSDAAMERRVTLTSHALTIFTARNMTVPVRVELHAERPQIDLGAWDHAVEASFAAPTGRIVVLDMLQDPATAPSAAVPSGPMRALVLQVGLATLSEDGLEGDDRYVVHLWPQASEPIRVLKQWVEPGERS